MSIKCSDFLSIEVGKYYTKEQLYEIFDCKELSNIKRKLTSLGYQYETNKKRGNNYRLVIKGKTVESVSLDCFRDFCRDKLKIVSIDYQKFAQFVVCLYNDNNFPIMYSPKWIAEYFNQQKLFISEPTVKKYLMFLSSNYLIMCDYSTMYYYIVVDDKIQQITKERYSEAWNYYFTLRKQQEDAYFKMLDKYGGKPMKCPMLQKDNALTQDTVKELLKLARAIIEK